MQKCYIYTRVSTEMQVDGFSLEAQEERCRAMAQAKGYTVVRVYCDAGKSGATLEGRDEFNQMIVTAISEPNTVHKQRIKYKLTTGEVKTLYIASSILKDDDGNKEGVILSFDDITKQENLEKAGNDAVITFVFLIGIWYFVALHVAYGPIYMLGAFALLFIFGFIYNKQRTIFGLCIPHFVLGQMIAILGFVKF